jgi:DNA-binding XRE family transcriptional regulator
MLGRAGDEEGDVGSASTSEGQLPQFGALLRQYRLAAGLTQQVLADRARLTVRGIADLERGIRRFPYTDTK